MLRGFLAIGRSAAAFVPLLVAVACASPTLPLPPPSLPTQAVGVDADHVTLSSGCGSVETAAVVVILNDNPVVPNDKAVSGALATPCGSWDASVYAHRGDLLEIRQESGTEESSSTKYVAQ